MMRRATSHLQRALTKRFCGHSQSQTLLPPLTDEELGSRIHRLDGSGRGKFKGPVTAVVLDWSGTTADAHTIAPTIVFNEVFERAGCPITVEEARGPMGIRKDLHIKAILEMPSVAKRWEENVGRPVDLESDVAKLYADFIPRQLEILDQYSTLLPGCAETLTGLQQQGVKVGVTTGFSRAMADILVASAAKQGYVPDFNVAGDDVENNMGARPAPFMVYKNLVNLGAWPIESVIKVDDCCSGVNEGINAGCWTVGVSDWSNYTQVESLEQWEAMPEAERKARQDMSRQKLLKESGAHYVADSIADLPKIVEDVNRRLALGEKP